MHGPALFWPNRSPSLPFGIAAPLFGLGGTLLSILGMLKTKERLYGVLALLWAFFPVADLQLYGPTPKGTAIMTWNIGKPDNERFSCALDTLADWTKTIQMAFCFYRRSLEPKVVHLKNKLD